MFMYNIPNWTDGVATYYKNKYTYFFLYIYMPLYLYHTFNNYSDEILRKIKSYLYIPLSI